MPYRSRAHGLHANECHEEEDIWLFINIILGAIILVPIGAARLHLLNLAQYFLQYAGMHSNIIVLFQNVHMQVTSELLALLHMSL